MHLAAGESPIGLLDILRNELCTPVSYSGWALRAGASIGAAIVSESSPLTFPEMMRAADHALYEAKRAGRGTWRLAERPGLGLRRSGNRSGRTVERRLRMRLARALALSVTC